MSITEQVKQRLDGTVYHPETSLESVYRDGVAEGMRFAISVLCPNWNTADLGSTARALWAEALSIQNGGK